MDDKELFLRAQKGDSKAKEELFNKNTGLVHHVVKRFLGRGAVESEDLFQIGSMGLLKAIEKFDTGFGVCFSTYAIPLIMGEIRRFLRDDGLIKVSRNIKENGNRIKRIREDMMQRLGREPTLLELSNESHISVEDITAAVEAAREVESLYKTMYESDGNELLLVDTIGAGLPGESSDNDRLLDKLLVDGLLKMLDEKEKALIRMRYYENKTQMQTAGALGMSQVQVSRLEKRVLIRLRSAAMA